MTQSPCGSFKHYHIGAEEYKRVRTMLAGASKARRRQF